MQISDQYSEQILHSYPSITSTMDGLYHADDLSLKSSKDHGGEEELPMRDESLQRCIQMKLVDFQSLLDTNNVSISKQNEILKA